MAKIVEADRFGFGVPVGGAEPVDGVDVEQRQGSEATLEEILDFIDWITAAEPNDAGLLRTLARRAV